jgi:hypothetical protein
MLWNIPWIGIDLFLIIQSGTLLQHTRNQPIDILLFALLIHQVLTYCFYVLNLNGKGNYDVWFITFLIGCN